MDTIAINAVNAHNRLLAALTLAASPWSNVGNLARRFQCRIRRPGRQIRVELDWVTAEKLGIQVQGNTWTELVPHRVSASIKTEKWVGTPSGEWQLFLEIREGQVIGACWR